MNEEEKNISKSLLGEALLANLLETLTLVNTSLNLNTVLESILYRGMQIIQAEAASILLLDEQGQSLRFFSAVGNSKEKLSELRLSPQEGVAGWVLQKGAPLRIAAVQKDSRFSGRVDRISGFQTRSLLAVPLRVEERITGVVEMLNKNNAGEFTSLDEEILTIIANSGALAIHKAQLYQRLEKLFLATVRSLADAIEAKDYYTAGHSQRIQIYSLGIAQELNIPEEQYRALAIAALLHDIGKIGIPESILSKPDKLTPEERQIINQHPLIAEKILAPIDELHNQILPTIRHHHEHIDGNGYPAGLKGEAIPLLSRIIAVADSYDAMTSDRAYRKRFSEEEAKARLQAAAGSQFDPACVSALLRYLAGQETFGKENTDQQKDIPD